MARLTLLSCRGTGTGDEVAHSSRPRLLRRTPRRGSRVSMMGRLRGWVRCRSSWVLEPERVVEPRVGGCIQRQSGPLPTTVKTLVWTRWRPNSQLSSSAPLRVVKLGGAVPERLARTYRRVHMGVYPSEVRSVHMSHFIIWSNSATYFGTPERARQHTV